MAPASLRGPGQHRGKTPRAPPESRATGSGTSPSSSLSVRARRKITRRGQPGLDVGGDRLGRLVGVDRDQDAPVGVVRDERARRFAEYREPVPDYVGLVVGATA